MGGCAAMYTFWSDGSRPAPSARTAPATWANGEDTNVAMPAKNTAIPPSTAATHGISSRLRCRFCRITSVAAPVRTVSHRSSDPSWLAQSDVIR